MTAVAKSFQALLESDEANSCNEYNDGFCRMTIEERQSELCQELLLKLERGGPSSSGQNIRQILGSQSISDVTPLLVHLLTSRVDRAALLPATQDVAANEEVMENSTSAMTLRLAMNSAALYAKLLSLPGALGAGLVDLESLTALNAVIRRWTVECCGREDQVSSSKQPPKSPTKSPPKKKSRRRPPSSIVLESEEEDDSFVGPQSLLEVGLQVSPCLLEVGLQVSLSLCEVPKQREFSSWSAEAREVVLDAIAAAFGTAAALKSLNSACPQVVQKASSAMKKCLQGSNKAQKHETSVILLRGLLNLLQLREVLPNGERGKLDAHSAASQALLGLIQAPLLGLIQSTATSSGTLADASNQMTPSKSARRRSGSAKMTPRTVGKTPKSQRKRRGSLPGGLTPMLSPALKG
eukprot:CAMPEP_0117011990 /NCGR_PEP_ID=MMETSP0472-20121206/10191_1 /TAXON_ID=693140 ORGANISM="Tiarina fusus, Strain LIS" /NCGR_SAMPLE_ID=MMETSP0472 /ASSEMBLY_ACC=CAM_ASM_000603 /LENGTH=408 /DNA_ID=CAMNT_0004714953 /DNA_START=89 /DNA_END=1313 /DNA_ORIENTATION=-